MGLVALADEQRTALARRPRSRSGARRRAGRRQRPGRPRAGPTPGRGTTARGSSARPRGRRSAAARRCAPPPSASRARRRAPPRARGRRPPALRRCRRRPRRTTVPRRRGRRRRPRREPSPRPGGEPCGGSGAGTASMRRDGPGGEEVGPGRPEPDHGDPGARHRIRARSWVRQARGAALRAGAPPRWRCPKCRQRGLTSMSALVKASSAQTTYSSASSVWIRNCRATSATSWSA